MRDLTRKASALLLSLVLTGTLSTTTVALAEDVTQGSSASNSPQTAPQQGDENEQKDDGEVNQIDEMDKQEGDVHQDLQQEEQQLNQEDVSDVNPDTLQTYSDVVTLLKEFQSYLATIKTTLAGDLQAGVTLNDNEKKLFDKLTNKHQNVFASANQRIDELNGVIQDLIDTLTPLADQPISETLGLKQLLLRELGDLREQAKGLKDLGGLDLEALKTETE